METNIKQIEAPKYFITLEVNDKVHEAETRDLKESILSFAPRFVKTKVLITIKNSSDKLFTKHLFVQDAKNLFKNKHYMNFFLNHMIFK